MDAKIVEIIGSLNLRCRIKASDDDDVSDWSEKIWSPVPSCFELFSCGPVPIRQIEWLDIDPVVTTKKGRLLPEMKEDKRDALVSALTKQKIKFEDLGAFIRIRSPKGAD
jgi:hypothetical protein